MTLVKSATSLHLHKCVARFVSESCVSCYYYYSALGCGQFRPKSKTNALQSDMLPLDHCDLQSYGVWTCARTGYGRRPDVVLRTVDDPQFGRKPRAVH